MRIKRPPLVLLACLATLVAGLLVLNFSPGEKKIDTQLTRLYDTGDPQFRRSLRVLLGPPIVDGNQVQVLLNGEQIFPAMLDAIRAARNTVDFETYIDWSGSIGKEFTQALSERARAGVKVHVLLDWIGSMKISEQEMDAMRRAGVELHRCHKPIWWKLARLNNRTHRKLLVVDGRIGFTGGAGIADKWRGHAQDADHWRDTRFRVEGPVDADFAKQQEAVFEDDWRHAQPFTRQQWDNRTWREKVGGQLADLIGAQL
jgi:cardiolipin synthase